MKVPEFLHSHSPYVHGLKRVEISLSGKLVLILTLGIFEKDDIPSHTKHQRCISFILISEEQYNDHYSGT